MSVDVNLAGHSWPVGTKVSAYERTGDSPSVGSAVKTATVDDKGLTFKGLDEGTYWAVGEGHDGSPQSVRFAAKSKNPAKKRTKPTLNEQAIPRATPSVEIVTGPKGTKVAGRTVEVPLPKGQEAHPHLNQASVSDSTLQRSSTPLGQATPVDPDEPQPKPRQQDVKRGVKQMSDTPLGEATPIVEEAGPEPQEDAPKRLKQRSDTEEGEQTPIGSAEPRGTASNPDSREAAAGVRRTDEKRAKGRGKDSKAAAKVRRTPRSKQG